MLFSLPFILGAIALGTTQKALHTNGTDLIVGFLQFFVDIPIFLLSIAVSGCVLTLSRQNIDKFNPFKELFNRIKPPYLKGIIITNILMGLLLLSWTIVPFIIVLIVVSFVGGETFFTFLFALATFIVGIWKICQYSQAIFLMYDIIEKNGKLDSSMQAITLSKELMKGHIWDFIRLQLSFIGWGLLALLTCGIGAIFLVPYTDMANAEFYRALNREDEELSF
jgi:uncharacterized membrane protein